MILHHFIPQTREVIANLYDLTPIYLFATLIYFYHLFIIFTNRRVLFRMKGLQDLLPTACAASALVV
jgi:hypothetical protein